MYKANVLAFSSSQTKRVCRSTLAAKASHLSESIECGDWIILVLHEALYGSVDLRNWTSARSGRGFTYITDARSVFDYVRKEASSTSSDKRMAIEGALLRETGRKENPELRWIDGQQSMANVLTKMNTDKTALNSVSARWTFQFDRQRRTESNSLNSSCNDRCKK